MDAIQFTDDFSDPTLGRFYNFRPGIGEVTRRDDGLHYRIIRAHGPPSSRDRLTIDYLGRPQPHTAQVHLQFESTRWTVEIAVDYDFDVKTNGRAACVWVVLGLPEERYDRSIEFVRYADLPPSSHSLSVTVRSSPKEPTQTQLTDQPRKSNWYRVSRSDQTMEAEWSEDGKSFTTVMKWQEPHGSVLQSVVVNSGSFAGGAAFILRSLRITGAYPREAPQRIIPLSMVGTQSVFAEIPANDIVTAIRTSRDISLLRCSIKGSLDLADLGSEITSNVAFDNCAFPNGFYSSGATTVAGQFTFTGCRLSQVGLSKVRFLQPFQAVGCEFAEDTRFIGTEFVDGADFSFSTFQHRPFFRILRCRRSLSLYFSNFISGGDFSEMQIGGDLSISDIDLKSGTLTFRQSSVAGIVGFFATLQRDPPPRFIGAIDFSNATIGQLIISSADPQGHNEYTGPPRWDLAADVFLRETEIRKLVLHRVNFLGTVDFTSTRKKINSIEKTTVGVAKLIGGWPITKEFHSCFISYSTKDTNFVERLHDLLAENGVECWFAPESLKIGDQFPTSIEDALNKFDKVLLVLSDESVKSDWVRREVEICLRRERTGNSLIICPIRLDDSITGTSESWAASIRDQRHIGDFRGWTEPEKFAEEFNRLLDDLRVRRD